MKKKKRVPKKALATRKEMDWWYKIAKRSREKWLKDNP
jgi:hypothetical protein